MRYAVVNKKVPRLVLNIVEWDGESAWTPPDGTVLVQSNSANLYDVYDPQDGSFTPAVPQVDPLQDDYDRLRDFMKGPTGADIDTYLGTANAQLTTAQDRAAIKTTIRALRSLMRVVRSGLD